MSLDQSVITQVLFKKYQPEYNWLLYNDLSRIIDTYTIKYKIKKSVNAKCIYDISEKIHPLLQKIDEVKTLRSIPEILENKEDNPQEDISKLTIDELINSQDNDDKIDSSFKTEYIFIDSSDRNIEKWENINPFQFSLGTGSIDLIYGEDNTISQNFSNVESFTIVHIILPSLDSNSNSINDLPYILLTIDEIGGNTHGTNKFINNSFGQLTVPCLSGKYNHYHFDDNETGALTKTFHPRIELSKLTFHFKNAEGDTIEFDNNDKICIEAHVRCLSKQLKSTFFNRPF